MKAAELAKAYRVTNGKKFRLKDIDPRDTGKLHTTKKEDAPAALREGLERLTELQNRLYAQDRWALLLIFQAMDAAGKDSTIKHVMSGVNPQGCQVYYPKLDAPKRKELEVARGLLQAEEE